MLGLEPGQAVSVTPQKHFDADAPYLTKEGRVIRLACAFRSDVLRISEASGVWGVVRKEDAERRIAGRIVVVSGQVA